MISYSKLQRKTCIDPLVRAIQAKHTHGETLVVGIQGGQGTGKTTLTTFLVQEFSKQGFNSIGFSIDDFYTDMKARKSLSRRHHDNPFYLLPRGMPGTHRVSHLYSVIHSLKQGKKTELPVFDKSLHEGFGDVAKRTVKVKEKIDFAFFEGWCVGMPVATVKELLNILRRFGVDDIVSGLSRKHMKEVLDQVRQYQRVWELLDYLIMIMPDNPALHLKWRNQQENDLRRKHGKGLSKTGVLDLVNGFLPFTYLCYSKINPDVRVRVDSRHKYRLSRR